MIDWLRSFPGKDGRPTGRILPGLIAFVIIELCLVGAFLLVCKLLGGY